VTVNDVAKHAGVSQSTVSQVLGGSRPVAQATRVRVLRSIEVLGYHPNQLARALRQQRSQTVAIVVPNIYHELYPAVARGVSEVLRPLGYQVALYDTDNVRAIETQVIRSIAERATDGAVIFGYPLSRADARILTDLGIALVNGGLDDEVPHPWDTVRVAQAEAVRDLVELVGSHYDGPIAYLGGPTDHPTSAVRKSGFAAGMERLGRSINGDLIATVPQYSFDAAYQVFGELLDTDSHIRLVICANDLLAIGVMAVARERGYRVPDDIAVTGYDNIVAAQMSVPPLTTVETFPNEQGRTCAKLLLDRMVEGYGGRPRLITLPTQIINRKSA